MFNRLKGLLYGSTPAEFVSAYGLSESVERLAAATKRSVFSSWGETSAVGKVSESQVRLQRVIPMVNNSFKPFFFGRFEVRDGVTMLTGRFTLTPFVKIFVTVWVGMLLLVGGGMLASGVKTPGSAPPFVLIQPLLMVVGGVLLVAFGKWLSRNDVAWLSSVIGRALGNAVEGSNVMAPPDETTVPIPLKAASLFLAASGVMQFVARFLPRTPPGGHADPRIAFPMPMFDGWQELLGFALLLLALAIWRRRPAGWWGGFVVLAVGFFAPLNAMQQQFPTSPPIIIEVIFGVIALCISVIWGLWWYAQRKHFDWAES
jgi:hypothetical protein